jgi:hypothetical protein
LTDEKATTGTQFAYTQFGKPHAATYAFAEKMMRRHLNIMGRDPDGGLNVYVFPSLGDQQADTC